MSDRTTINIKKELRQCLNEKKIYKRETYDEVLSRLLGKGLKSMKKGGKL